MQSGHNALITWKAGTGKSFLVQQIVKSLVRSGKRVRVVCSSGIACTVYTETNACTVHSFYRLRTAKPQWKQLVERSCRDSQVVQNIQTLDCLIWDEVSMSSRRTLGLANLIHLHVNEALNNPMPFDGIQLVLVGDFQQLRPVPSSCFNLPFSSKLFHIDSSLLSLCARMNLKRSFWLNAWMNWEPEHAVNSLRFSSKD